MGDASSSLLADLARLVAQRLAVRPTGRKAGLAAPARSLGAVRTMNVAPVYALSDLDPSEVISALDEVSRREEQILQDPATGIDDVERAVRKVRLQSFVADVRGLRSRLRP
jgi:hypothetical protein